MDKTRTGNFFEHFSLGQILRHATPRTVTVGDVALYTALTGSRFAQHCSDPFARGNGLERAPIEGLLAFHIVFGKTVPDISRNAIANLGYADGLFHGHVWPGDTLTATSEVIGLKEVSSGEAGIVYVRTRGQADDGRPVLDYCRWVMVRKRDRSSKPPKPHVPELPKFVAADRLSIPAGLAPRAIDPVLSGSPFFFEDYTVGERIDHVDGTGVKESEHRLATRLYQNTSRVHFDDHRERAGRLGACVVYGGVVISIARALSFNGLGNILHLLAINAGTHANPCLAGDTIYAWSEVLDAAPLRHDLGALRLRLVAVKNRACADFPLHDKAGRYLPDVLLDFDYWALIPTRAAAA